MTFAHVKSVFLSADIKYKSEKLNMINITLNRLRLVISLLLLGTCLQADAEITTSDDSRHRTFTVPINKTKIINLDIDDISRWSQSKPSIVDVILDPPKQLILRGQSIGVSNFTVWGKDNKVALILDVEVTQNLQEIKQKLHEVLPHEPIQVHGSGQCIILSGEVSSLVNIDFAMKLAQGYAYNGGSDANSGSGSQGSSGGGTSSNSDGNNGSGIASDVGDGSNTGGSNGNNSKFSLNSNNSGGSNNGGGCGDRTGGNMGGGGNSSQLLVNMMHLGGEQQVMLEVKIAEVSHTLARALTLQNTNGASNYITSTDSTGKVITTKITSSQDGSFLFSALAAGAGAFTGNYIAGNTLFNWSLNVSRNVGLATILAEPNLSTLSGKKASFISGGEFPYNGGCALGACTVSFKQYGVGLEFTPVVLDSNRINLTTHVSVSSLSNAANQITGASAQAGVPLTPSLDTREAVTTLELSDGQTMSIAGLISDNQTNNQEQTPGLADIPGLGSLFRNRHSGHDKKEVVIMITPHLAKPLPPEMIRLPTDNYVAPDDIEFYLLGRMEARKAQAKIAQRSIDPSSGGTNGQFGHQINDGVSK